MQDPAVDVQPSVPVLSLALLQKIQSWEGLLENLPVGIYLTDRDGAVARYNRRAAELCGGPPADCIWSAEAPIRDALRTGQPIRDRAVTIVRPDGTQVAVLANIEPLFDDNGTVIGAVNCLRELADTEAAESRREQDRNGDATHQGFSTAGSACAARS